MTLSVPINALTITITMKSDWHVGSGMGRGELDSVIQRDADGLPYIPAKTLTGILRDGCEQVAMALDHGTSQGIWQDWVNFLFGDQPALAKEAIETEPNPALLSIHSAYLDQKLRNALWAKSKLKTAITFMKPGVKIDPKTGTTELDCLRFEEVARMGAVLEGKAELNFPNSLTDHEKKTAYALLLTGAKNVDRLGGKRRRGNGCCQIEITPNAHQWITWLKDNHQNTKNPPLLTADQLQSTQNNPSSVSPWFKIPLTITTQSPLIVPSRTVGNVVESLDYIPGRYLLRHLHQTLGKFLDISQAIAEGDFILTNATIAIRDNAGRPTPFCLFSEKLDGGLSKGKGVYNRFQETEPKGIQLKGERGGYIGKLSSQELPHYQAIGFELYTHNTIEDEVQRPTSEVGGVYSYQAIPAGTVFKAELRLPTSLKKYLDASDKNWWQKLSGSTNIGQSKKDQYGKIKITADQPIEFQNTALIDKTLTIWLLSDLLLRGSRLNLTLDPTDLKATLERELGVELAERPDEQLLSLMLRSRRTESWQGRWGLPRPSLVGWQAGSCVIYEVKSGQIDPNKVLELMATGIGDRRAEGYGQISFNDPLLEAPLSPLTRKPDDSDSVATPKNQTIPSNHSTFAYARLIETAAWREAIQNKALAIAADRGNREIILGIKISSDENSQPSMTQLGAFRSVLRRLQSNSDADKAIITGWLTALESVANRKEKWDNTNQGLSKIRELVTQSEKVWQHLGLNFTELTITQGGEAQLKNELWAEAVRTLVDAIIRAHKRDLEPEQNQEVA